MLIRAFSTNIVGGLMDHLDTLGERYKTSKLEPDDSYIEFDFEEQSGLIAAQIFEASDYVASFSNPEQKREAFIQCCEQLRLIEKDEIERFASLAGYAILEKV